MKNKTSLLIGVAVVVIIVLAMWFASQKPATNTAGANQPGAAPGGSNTQTNSNITTIANSVGTIFGSLFNTGTLQGGQKTQTGNTGGSAGVNPYTVAPTGGDVNPFTGGDDDGENFTATNTNTAGDPDAEFYDIG